MKRVLVLGANGQIARFAIDLYVETTDVVLTLYARNIERLREFESGRVWLLEGDVLNLAELQDAVAEQDVVYANLDGELEAQATNVVAAMKKAGVKRLIWVSAMGVYDEVPEENPGEALEPYRKSVAIIEASDLDYTILRPARLSNKLEVDYETTEKGETFKNSDKKVSRLSVADLVVNLTMMNDFEIRKSLGVHYLGENSDED